MDYIKFYVGYFKDDKSITVEVFPYVNIFKENWTNRFSQTKPLFIHAGVNRPNNTQINEILNSNPSGISLGVSAKFILEDIIEDRFNTEFVVDNLLLYKESSDSMPKIDKRDRQLFDEHFISKIDITLLNYPVMRLPLGVRSKRCLKSKAINSIYDLICLTESDLAKIPNFGRSCLEEIKSALHSLNLNLGMIDDKKKDPSDKIERSQKNQELDDVQSDNLTNIKLYNLDQSNLENLIYSFKNIIDEQEFSIYAARIGLVDRPITLEIVGEKYGFTRERARQIESKAYKKIVAIVDIIQIIDKRLYKVRENLFIPLYVNDLPSYDPWFDILKTKPWVLKSILNSEDLSLHNVQTVGSDEIVGLGKNGSLADMILHIKSYLTNMVEKNFSRQDLKEYIKSISPSMANEITNYIFSKISSSFKFIDSDDDSKALLVASGWGAAASLRKVLESSNVPLKLDKILEALEVSSKETRKYSNELIANDIFFTFDSSKYGLRKHLNLNDNEVNFVNEAIKAYVLENGSERQWHTREIMDNVSFTQTIRSKLDRYKLAICVQISSYFTYLGRFLFVLKDAKHETVEKLNYSSMVERILESSPEPLFSNEIKRMIILQRGVSNVFQIHNKGNIVPIKFNNNNKSKYGLVNKHLNLTRSGMKSIISEMLVIVENQASFSLTMNEAIKLIRNNEILKRFIDNIATLFYLCDKSVYFVIKDEVLYHIDASIPDMSQLQVLKLVASKITKLGLKKQDLLVQVETLYGKSIPGNLTNFLSDYGFVYDQGEKTWYRSEEFAYLEN